MSAAALSGTTKEHAMIDAAIVGLGRWGKAIVEAVQGKSRSLRFVRGVSKEPETVRAFAAAKDFRLSGDFADVLADPDVRAVVLATPHSLHVDQIVAVAKTGKAVWCEKPLALTLAEAARAVAACRDANVVLGLGNNKRLFPAMVELKKPGCRRNARRNPASGRPFLQRALHPCDGRLARQSGRVAGRRHDRGRAAHPRRLRQSGGPGARG
jgi:hypothetical protein